MGDVSSSAQALGQAVLDHALGRVDAPDESLGATASAAQLSDALAESITPGGLGGEEALRLFEEVIEPACLHVDHPRFLSFVPAAPTPMALLGDILTSAARIYGGSWLEGAGAVQAENDVLRWIAGTCGLPPSAGGVFVPGGTNGNTSALIAARHRWRQKRGPGTGSGRILTSEAVHASVPQAAQAMDAELVSLPGDPLGRLDRRSLEAATRALGSDRSSVFAIVATAGTTNAGVVDDLTAAADAAATLDCWLHIDGAYGLAAAAGTRARHLFESVGRTDSLIVDPHKWLFGPFDSCALLYKDPSIARAAHTQRADYLEILQSADDNGEPSWNPSDYALHLSRRPRGLPMWFSLVALGTEFYATAVDSTIDLAREAAALLADTAHLEVLVEPDLSTLVFRRIGWDHDQYLSWSRRTIAAGTAVLLPTTWNGETVLRMCIVNPQTTIGDIKAVVEALQ
ncbi:MAG: pyridoxal phosphate-dependent decarboxylase family protein [Microthrixaceae bacterium]